jgi:hypothetical protein
MGKICLFKMADMMFFCEEVAVDLEADQYVFPAKRTVLFMSDQGSVNHVRADRTPGSPSEIRLSRTYVMATDCNDEQMRNSARAAISGLVMVSGNGR